MNLDLFNNLKNLMPGDTRTETIVVKNTSTGYDYVKIYLRAEPASTTTTATASGDVTMAEFLSRLTLSVYQDGQLISTAPAAEPGALSENLCLGTFYPNDTVTLALTATVPAGLGNKYAHASGDIVWIFTTEAYQNELPVNPTPATDTQDPETNPPAVAPTHTQISNNPDSSIFITVSNSIVQDSYFAQATSIPEVAQSPTQSSSNPTSTSAVTTTQSALVINLNTAPLNFWFIAFVISTLAFIFVTAAFIRLRKKSKIHF